MTSIIRTLLGALALLLTTQPADAADLCDALGVPFVVRGRVTSVTTDRTTSTAVVHILYVYRGPAELAGKTFEDISRRTGVSRGLSPASPPLREGEEGLWTLSESTSGRGPRLLLDPWYPLFRARKDNSPRYPQAVALAEAVERLCHTPADRQVALAHDYALSETPELAVFAIRALARVRSSDADEVVDRLVADQRLNPAAQVALDDALTFSRDRTWVSSPQRQALLRRWVAGKPPAAGSPETVARFDDIVYHSGLDLATYLGLMKTAADNPAISPERRQQIVTHVLPMIFQSPYTNRFTAQDEATGLAWLAEQVRNSATMEVRLGAARQLEGLARHGPQPGVERPGQPRGRYAGDPRAAEIVRQLLANISDEKVRAALQGR
jgi:hypothetical protein